MPEVALDLTSLSTKNIENFIEEKIILPTEDERTLSALKIYKKDVSPERWLLFLPEMAASAETWKKYLYSLPAKGWGILALDFPGCGNSTPYEGYKVRKFLTTIELKDAETALNMAIELSSASESSNKVTVPVFGISRGAVAALTLAHTHQKISMVVADSPFCSTEVIKASFKRIGKIYAPEFIVKSIPDFVIHQFVLLAFGIAGRKNNCSFINLFKVVSSSFKQPVLVINGLNDKFSTPEHIKTLIDKSKSNWEQLEIKGAKHNGAVITEPELYQKKITNFLS